jgi:hypothetical protein
MLITNARTIRSGQFKNTTLVRIKIEKKTKKRVQHKFVIYREKTISSDQGHPVTPTPTLMLLCPQSNDRTKQPACNIIIILTQYKLQSVLGLKKND